ncbi:iron transporter biosynthesis regulating transcription factor, partial [Conidiobolus coronatus NRRL 28638]
CANCGTDHTPLWRRAPDGSTVCNACGLYLKSNNSDRPNRLKKSPPKTSCSSSASGKVCANCSATTTPLWRRDDSGATICNACGLYYKLHKSHRPVSLKKTVIKRRKR